jgi:S-adenosylmethionine:tRNA ribosyltransferase-isomerase
MADESAERYRLEHYDYLLPEDLIAHSPCERREASRLLVLERSSGRIEHLTFKDVVDRFRSGDLLVVNDTQVVPARLHGVKETGGKVELLVLDPY